MVVHVDVENFTKAETHLYMKKFHDKIGKTNTFFHYRDFDLDNTVIRMNLDTLYSIAILDSRKSDITLVVPQIKDRYFSACILDERHYEKQFISKPGEYKFTQSKKYLLCLIRILVKHQKEIPLINKIQDEFTVIADNYSNNLYIPNWDKKSYKYTRDLVSKLFKTAPHMTSDGMFGKKGKVNELKHLMGVQMGWGGLDIKHAIYDTFIPKNNDGKIEYSLTVKDVPVKAFWSIIVYDKDGYILPDPNKRSLNNYTAVKNKDGSYTINFSNDPKKKNNLNIIQGWNYTVRMYEPTREAIKGKWKFPLVKEIS